MKATQDLRRTAATPACPAILFRLNELQSRLRNLAEITLNQQKITDPARNGRIVAAKKAALLPPSLPDLD
jgi:hypothetical protein